MVYDENRKPCDDCNPGCPVRLAGRWVDVLCEKCRFLRLKKGPFPITGKILINYYVNGNLCPSCGGDLDTGWECNNCNFDARDIAMSLTPPQST